MSYVYMKALEKKAERYDKGIKTLTFGKYPKIQQFIADNYLNDGENLLDIGMGTGTFAILAANKGLNVTGIDFSEKMLIVAKKNIKKKKLSERINIKRTPIINLDKEFKNYSFDKVTAMLLFSELYEKEQDFTLDQVYRILKDTGEFILVDEVKPKVFWKKVLFFIIRVPLVIITFLKSQLTTKALKNFEERLKNHRFEIIDEKYYLLDTLKLFRIQKRVDEKE
ncbi:MAG: corrinoid protein-associated methyltransferase CpaM [Promethearchaeota archaeon]